MRNTRPSFSKGKQECAAIGKAGPLCKESEGKREGSGYCRRSSNSIALVCATEPAPRSFAISAITGAAPEPVPPPERFLDQAKAAPLQAAVRQAQQTRGEADAALEQARQAADRVDARLDQAIAALCDDVRAGRDRELLAHHGVGVALAEQRRDDAVHDAVVEGVARDPGGAHRVRTGGATLWTGRSHVRIHCRHTAGPAGAEE